MTKPRKNYVMRISSILLILTMISLCMVSGTFAKYVGTATASDTATVAKFSVKLGDKDIAKSESITVDLFKNSYLNGNVVGVGSKKVIAPGTSGYFKIETKNEGEVAVKTTFKLQDTNNGIPIRYAITDSETAPAEDTAWKTAVETTTTEQSLAIGASGDAQYLHWKWITESDPNDTNLGTAESPVTVTTTISCTVEQDTGD